MTEMYDFSNGRGMASEVSGMNTATSMTVTWPASKRANVTVYLLQYRALGSTVWINANQVMQSGTTAVISGLTTGTTYEVRTIASNKPDWIDVSTPTQLRAGDIRPSAPTGLKVTF